MTRRNYPLAKVYGLLEPGPVVLLTTAHKGRMNVMSQSWHTMMEFEPPLVGCIVSGNNFSFAALRATRECVLNIPTAELADKVVAVGNSSGRKTDKFHAFGLTPQPASLVAAPLIAECYANLECRVADTHGQPLQLLCPRSRQGLDRPDHPRTPHPPPPRSRRVHDARRDDQAAVADEIAERVACRHG